MTTQSVPFQVDPAHREALAEAGLLTLDACRAFQGGTVVKALVPGRTTESFEAGGRAYYIKRITGQPNWEIANEAGVLTRLGARGLPVASVAAFGADADFGALIMTALPVRGTLEQELVDDAADVAKRRRQLCDIVRKLHDLGVQHRDFYMCHVLVGEDDGLYVADFGRARPLGILGWPRRVRDLAGLDYSTPARVVSDWSRIRFLRQYAGPIGRFRFKLLSLFTRRKARIMRRHIERQIARLEPNFHIPR